MHELFWVERGAYEEARLRLEDADLEGTERVALLERLALYGRIDTLSTIHHSGRGWIGACFSIMDVLTVLYFDGYADAGGDDHVLLSKGHAAVAQYAVLAGLGVLGVEDLLRHNMPEGPQAHPDCSTRGIASNSGSLGQALSKGVGLALGGARRVFVVLGDGELQEGQNFEAFMSLCQFGAVQVVPIVDMNGIQSDSNVADIKPIADLRGVLEGLGLDVISFPGNDPGEIRRALMRACRAVRPTVLLARTRKAAGISFMEADSIQRRGFVWHGRAPDEGEYMEALRELSKKRAASEIAGRLSAFLRGRGKRGGAGVAVGGREDSTGAEFGRALVELAEREEGLRVLDADLEKSCNLAEFARRHPARFIEMGIAEQDMVSCAGGLALRGFLPVVNTYAAFLRRGFEQIYANATERTRVVYAGHYAGLCYGTDGKSHQCTGDVAMMRSIPGMHVLYPAFKEDVQEMLDWYVGPGVEGPLYLRLHRQVPELRHLERPAGVFCPGEGIFARRSAGSRLCVVTCGPHLVQYACVAVDELRGRGMEVDLCYTVTLRGLGAGLGARWREWYDALFVVEETHEAGGLFDEVALCLASSAGAKGVRVYRRAMRDFTFSTLERYGLYRHFGFDAAALGAEIERYAGEYQM